MADFFDVQLGRDLFVQFVATSLAATLCILIAYLTNEWSHRAQLRLQLEDEARKVIAGAAVHWGSWVGRVLDQVHNIHHVVEFDEEPDLDSLEGLKYLNELARLLRDTGPYRELQGALADYRQVLPFTEGMAPFLEEALTVVRRNAQACSEFGTMVPDEELFRFYDARAALETQQNVAMDFASIVHGEVLHKLFGSAAMSRTPRKKGATRLRLVGSRLEIYTDLEGG